MRTVRQTCNQCGTKAAQSDMYRHTELVKSGTSQRAFLWRNLFGWLLGILIDDRRIANAGRTAMTNWAVGNHKRQYRRERTYWFCWPCLEAAAAELEGGQ